MRRHVWRAARWAVVAGVAAAAVGFVRPGERPVAVDAYVLFLGALALLVLVAATRDAVPADGTSPFARALAPSRRPAARPGSLEALEGETLLAVANAFDLHYRLRPILREVAEHRLSSRRGIDLERDPAAARAVLGDEAWELVRPDREPPADRLGPGLPLARIRAAVDALESV